MEMLRKGKRSPQVKLLQCLVNARLSPSPALQEDGIYGPKTELAIRQFQSKHKRLAVDGIVGPNTWRQLGITIDVSHHVRLHGQPTNMTCWSAAATMLLGGMMSVSAAGADTGPKGGLRASFSNVKTFADAYNLRMHAPRSWTVQGLATVMRRGPIWVAGWVPSGHAVIYAAIHGDGSPDGTLIVIYDPWPPGKGEIRGEIYGDWMRKHSAATTYVLEKKGYSF